MGDVTELSNFLGAVIDDQSFSKLAGALERAKKDTTLEVLAGDTVDDSDGWFVRPTLLRGSDPAHDIFTTEYFGPILGLFVYDDGDYDSVVRQAADVASYALTGAIFAQDRRAVVE